MTASKQGSAKHIPLSQVDKVCTHYVLIHFSDEFLYNSSTDSPIQKKNFQTNSSKITNGVTILNTFYAWDLEENEKRV